MLFIGMKKEKLMNVNLTPELESLVTLSNRKPEIVLSELAQQDLTDILQYTLEHRARARLARSNRS
jgi:hypothetical protein